MKRIFVFPLAFILLISVTACKRIEDSETIRFAVGRNDWSALVTIADVKGYFDEQGLNVEVFYLDTGTQCLEAIISGSAPIGTISDGTVASFGFTDSESISVVSSINMTASSGIIARRSSGVYDPSDLIGKKLAITPGSTGEIFALVFLERHNLTGGVELVNIQANAISASIISGSVDAISSWGPYLYNAQKTLAEDISYFGATEADLFDYYIAVANDYARENRDKIVKILIAIEKAADFAESNLQEAQEIVANAVNLDIEFVKDVWKLHDFNATLSNENLDRVIRIAEYYKENETNRGKPFPDYSIYFDFSFTKDAR